MLREAGNVEFVQAGWPLRRCVLQIGRRPSSLRLPRRRYLRRLAAQRDDPSLVITDGTRRYWWFHDRFWWEDDTLDSDDVRALVLDRERRARRRLERAHALMQTGSARAPVLREGISQDVKRSVWERCGGRCAECGATSLLEFDHVIPLAMGGSNGERNLQLLCADCNRAKGDGL